MLKGNVDSVSKLEWYSTSQLDPQILLISKDVHQLLQHNVIQIFFCNFPCPDTWIEKLENVQITT